MRANPQKTADLVTFTEVILNAFFVQCMMYVGWRSKISGGTFCNNSWRLKTAENSYHGYLTRFWPPLWSCKIKNFQSRNSPQEVFLRKAVLKICRKFTGELPCLSVISVKLLCTFIEITLCHGCSPVNFLQFFRTHFYMNTYGGLLLSIFLFDTLYWKSSANTC